jgi:biotin-(acetyl-CoA carboxylase) ligase
VSAQIKWPNDILISGRKIGGILAEAVFNVRCFACCSLHVAQHASYLNVA